MELKKKFRWIVEGFDNKDTSIFNECVKIHARPSVNSCPPIRDQFSQNLEFEFGFILPETNQTTEEIQTKMEKVKHLKLYCRDGENNTFEEFDMEKTKVFSISWDHFNYDEKEDCYIQFKYTKSQYKAINLNEYFKKLGVK